jgi:hypothetical protein
MDEQQITSERQRIAALVRDACLRSVLEAYERASLDGLCCEGAFECAMDALRSLDVKSLLEQPVDPSYHS